MRRWDRLVERYVEEYRARGIGEATVAHTASRLNRWGGWLKEQRPRVATEQIDAQLITRYAGSSVARMLRAGSRGVLPAAIAIVAACAGPSGARIPLIIEEPLAPQVRVLSDKTERVAEVCTRIAEVLESDGAVGAPKSAYDGTRERVIVLLRNRAVQMDADTVLIREDATVPDPLALDGARGSLLALAATLYRCASR